MNELEFRAFHRGVMLHNCAVINGSLAIEENPKGDNLHVTDEGGHYYNDWAKYVIYPDSKLMQYTGLKDANGVKIFKGDIIRHREGYVWTVIYESAESRFALVCKPPLIRPLSSTRARNVKVIGNIDENPELRATEGLS